MAVCVERALQGSVLILQQRRCRVRVRRRWLPSACGPFPAALPCHLLLLPRLLAAGPLLGREALSPAPPHQDHVLPQEQDICSACDLAPHSLAFPQTCLSIPDIKTAFSDCTSKIGRRDCLTQACSALTG